MKSKTKTRLIMITIIIIILFGLVSYGYYYVSSNQNDRNRLSGGCFNTSFSDGASINLTNALPETFEDALKDDPYTFTITNSCTLPAKYFVLLNIKSGSFNLNI